MSFISEMWAFMKTRKKLWLFPILMVMTAIGGLLVFSSGTAVAPFIYTLF